MVMLVELKLREASPGTRAFRIEIEVNGNQDLRSAIKVAAPDTFSGKDVFKLDDSPVPMGLDSSGKKRLVCVNFGEAIENLEPALQLGRRNQLKGGTFRDVLALSRQGTALGLDKTIPGEFFGFVAPGTMTLRNDKVYPSVWWFRRRNYHKFLRKGYARTNTGPWSPLNWFVYWDPLPQPE